MKLESQLKRNFVVVAVAGILLASLVAALLIRGQQVRSAERAVALITRIVGARVESGALPTDNPRLERLVEAAGGRLLLVSAPDGEILSDSAPGEGSLVGETLPARALFAAARDPLPPTIRQTRLQGNPYYLSALPVRVQSEGERMVVAVPMATVLESWLSLLPGVILMSGLGVALAWLIGNRFSSKLTQPLAALNQAATSMANGDYDARVNTTSEIQEVKALTTAFNTMADEVKSSRQVQRDFLANVSHDLRTPLTSIQGFSQAMMDGAVPAEQQHKVATIIHSEAGRLSRLVLDLLDLARIEAGRFAMSRRDLNLKTVLSQVCETFSQQAERAGVTLDLALPSRSLPLFADSDRLAQVFGNLLDNAITYAQQGGKHVKVSAALGGVRDRRAQKNSEGEVQPAVVTASDHEAKPAPLTIRDTTKGSTGIGASHAPDLNGTGADGSYASDAIQKEEGTQPTDKPARWWAEVTISDDGPGVEPEQQLRMFERFHRGDAPRGGGGMGLGLAIAKEIVEAHGGDISVQAREGNGTTFIVRLPLKMW